MAAGGYTFAQMQDAYQKFERDAVLSCINANGRYDLCTLCSAWSDDSHIRGRHTGKIASWQSSDFGAYNKCYYCFWSIHQKINGEADRLTNFSWFEAVWRCTGQGSEADFNSAWIRFAQEARRQDWLEAHPWIPHVALQAAPAAAAPIQAWPVAPAPGLSVTDSVEDRLHALEERFDEIKNRFDAMDQALRGLCRHLNLDPAELRTRNRWQRVGSADSANTSDS